MINVTGVSMIQSQDAVEKEALLTQIAELKGELSRITEKKDTMKKNQKPGKASPTRKYVLLAKSLDKWGTVPQQQSDIATLLNGYLVAGTEYTEQEVFDALIDGSGEFKSLYSSKQDPTYLFRYYRGLKNDGKHAGFIARGFLKVID